MIAIMMMIMIRIVMMIIVHGRNGIANHLMRGNVGSISSFFTVNMF